MTLAQVHLWGRRIGAVRQDDRLSTAVFDYEPGFLASRVEPSPIRMAKRQGNYQFPALPRDTFQGLPGMLWDSLPDRFGRRLIERYFQTTGRPPESLDAVQMLCYVGSRGMGALEFTPSVVRPSIRGSIDISELRAFAALAMSEDQAWTVDLDNERGLQELLDVGTSAGGRRPKAVIGWNPETHEVRSGRVELDDGFEYWLLKFDGISDDGDELGESRGYGAIELAYSVIARRAGIEMTECRLLEESGRRHFMTKRFDRNVPGRKLHMQTLAGLTHVDFNQPGSASYEDVFDVLRTLRAQGSDFEQQFLRTVFNVVARNQDDHPKNVSFLMDRDGEWRLSPAYDVSHAFNPVGKFTSRHQMSVNGKLDGFVREDFAALARHAGLVQGRWNRLVDQVIDAVSTWPTVAEEHGVRPDKISSIRESHRLSL